MAEYGLRVRHTIKETTMNSKEVHKQVQQIRMKFEKEIADFIVSHPDDDYTVIGKRFGVVSSRIAQIAVKYDCRRPRGGWREAV